MSARIDIRPATEADIAPARELVQAAYRLYIPRMGKPPGPMLDDYAQRQRQGELTVALIGAEVVGIVVMVRATDHLHLDNVAVHPRWQRRCHVRCVAVRFVNDRRANHARHLAQDRRRSEVAGHQHVCACRSHDATGRKGQVRHAACELWSCRRYPFDDETR